jgi:hypothetical protein
MVKHHIVLVLLRIRHLIGDLQLRRGMYYFKKGWRLWAKSLGEKVGETDKQADAIAVIRTCWWFTHMATCIFIILNAIANHGWGLIGL